MLRGLEVPLVFTRLFGWSNLWVLFTDSRKDLAPVKRLAEEGTGTLGYALIMLTMLCYYLDHRQSTLNRIKKTIMVQQRVAIYTALSPSRALISADSCPGRQASTAH